MATEEIVYTVTDRVATIALNRPDKLNAWTATMEREVRYAVEAHVPIAGAGLRGFRA
jgi:enoyl-CoA hydratase/carnithine racemase